MRWYQRIIAAHTAVTNSVSHYKRLDSARYFVWQEDGGDDFDAGNVHAERAWHGTTDLYTRTEFDPWIDALSAAFDAQRIAYDIVSVDYEPETEMIHTQWAWTVPDGTEENNGEDGI